MGYLRTVLKKIKFVDELYIKYKWRQRKVSWGNQEEDKVFYVIRRATCKVGLFSYVMTTIGQIEYAVKRGYIPVVDMQNNENTYLDKDLIGKKNAWEYYFKQPCGYSLQDIRQCKNVILGNGLITEKSEYPTSRIFKDHEEFQRWFDICKKYVTVQDDIKKDVQDKYESLFGKERVLGILCRGTDYVRLQPHGHPVQPTIEQMIEKAKAMKREYHCKWIYLATEDEQYYQAFLNQFGEELRVTEAKRCAEDGKFNINDISYDRENDRYLRGREYLMNVMLLSKCTCLLAGAVGGTYGAALLSDGYEQRYIFDLGVYQ